MTSPTLPPAREPYRVFRDPYRDELLDKIFARFKVLFAEQDRMGRLGRRAWKAKVRGAA